MSNDASAPRIVTTDSFATAKRVQKRKLKKERIYII